MKESMLTQDSLDRGHKLIDKLIDMTDKARVEACNAGETDARDILDEMGAYMKLARSKAGKLSLDNGGIKPRAGDK